MRLHPVLIIYFILILLSTADAQYKYAGEMLKYRVESLNMSVGSIQLTIDEIIGTHSSDSYHLSASARTGRLISPLFSVKNVYDNYFYVSSFLPSVMRKNVRQTNIQQNVEIRYDQDNHMASIADTLEWAIPDSCHNFFSMFYLLRELEIDASDTIRFHLDSESEISRAAVNYTGTQTISCKLGNLPARGYHIHFEPMNTTKRPWKTDLITNRLAQQDSEMVIWLSDDNRRIPLYIHFIQRSFDIKLRLQSANR
ncbi:MAG: DUF3108 domain-containing protein [candidate division KSB1 bacterium]|jgi:hypothetical protein|nr:DUF3108 domain-containing protein [candidate division KSB1 bacterium]